jgi:zinc transporter ZupT
MIYLLPILAVILSFGLVYWVRPKNKERYKLLLAFSGAFLLSLTIFELLPEIYSNEHPKILGIWVMGGILLQIFLEFFSRGAEHGHVHKNSKSQLFPWLLFLSLSLHSLLEGVPVHTNETIIYGILIHKIPIAIILSIFLLASNLTKTKVILFITLFSIMTPLGTWLTKEVPYINDVQHYLNALAIGVFFHISTVILFESSDGHTFNLRKLVVIIMGIVIAYYL